MSTGTVVISLVAFLILVICILSLFFPLSVMLQFCQMYWSCQRTSALFHRFFSVFLFSVSSISVLCYSFLLLLVYFALFPGSWWGILKLLIWDFSSFLISIYCYRFLSWHCFSYVPNFDIFSVLFSLVYHLISPETSSLIQVLFTTVLFGFQVWRFSCYFSVTDSYFDFTVARENILCMI